MPLSIKTFDYAPDPDGLLRKLCLEPDGDEAEDFLALLAELSPRARPMAAFTEARVSLDAPEPDVLLVGGERFHGDLLRSRLRGAETVWPYVATCGREGYDRMAALSDPLERFWAEYVLEDALDAALRGMEEFFHHEVYAGKTASIAPGSLPEWPIEEQIPLFRLLGDAPARCGVTLTDSLLMLPNKSVSGIRFPSDEGYVSCVFCKREHCPRRQAPHDASASWAG
jgi:hypothetical protein